MNKFIVWGLGTYGKCVVIEFGSNYIDYIVDANHKIQGTVYKGIRVISPEEFYENGFASHPIFVTPRVYENEIKEDLKNHGSNIYFDYTNDFWLSEYYINKLKLDKVIDLEKENSFILGYNALSLAICMFLSDNGRKGIIVEPNFDDKLMNSLKENGYCVAREMPIIKDENYICYVVDEKFYNDDLDKSKFLDFYELETRKDLTTNPELRKFKGILKGKRCFIIATGSSLRIEDIDKLNNNGEICFSVNGIVNIMDKTDWRPDYYAMSDPVGLELFGDKLRHFAKSANFIAEHGWTFDEYYKKGNYYKCHVIYQDIDENSSVLPLISEDFSVGGYWGRTVVIDIALQMALYMEPNEIYFLGADTPRQGAQIHFYDKGSSSSIPTGISRNYNKIIKAYESARVFAEKRNIKIYNATRGGDLEVFPRVDFDALFD